MRCTPSVDEVRDRLAAEGRVPVMRELLADFDTPVSAYLKVAGTGRGFLLESVENGERSSRYSFLGGEPRTTLTFQDGIARLDRDGRVSARVGVPGPAGRSAPDAGRAEPSGRQLAPVLRRGRGLSGL